MKYEAEANAETDRKAKEKVDKLNTADSMIFQTEKQLKEYGDKLPADKIKPIEDALAELKAAHKSEDIATLDAATEKLSKMFQAASQEMYNATQGQQAGGQQGQQPGDGQGQPGGNGGAKKDDNVTDVDFEEVK